MALFSYKTGVWPISLEIAGARLSFEPGMEVVQLMLGGNGNRTGSRVLYFHRWLRRTLHTDMEHVHIKTVQDTDVSPFDTGGVCIQTVLL